MTTSDSVPVGLGEDVIEAARAAAIEALGVIPGSRITYPTSHAWTIAGAVLDAAMPIVVAATEARVREQVARDIEAQLKEPWRTYTAIESDQGLRAAARVARGPEATDA